VRFLECCSGKSGQPFIINEVDLDAAAFGWAAAAKSRSKAAHALHWQEAPPQRGAQRGFCPQKPSGKKRDMGAPAKARRNNNRLFY